MERATMTKSVSGPTIPVLVKVIVSSTIAEGRGGLKTGEMFVIAGHQNADYCDGDNVPDECFLYTALENALFQVRLPDSRVGSIIEEDC